MTVGIITMSVFAAVLEGVGLSFLIPIIQLARGDSGEVGNRVQVFADAYDLVGIPFTLEFVVVGVAVVMTARYLSSFVVAWLRARLRSDYVRELQIASFESAVDAEIAYFDRQGSDEILNAIVTQAKMAGRTIEHVTRIFEQGFLSLMYLGIALFLAGKLTIAAVVVLGVVLVFLQSRLESGFSVGDRVADANESVQQAAQAGTQGIRDVKLFGLSDELRTDFRAAATKFADATVHLRRNEVALDNIYQLLTAITVFGLIYVALTFTSLSLAGLGVFLFAMFRLAPRVSSLNNRLYRLDGEIPHLVRTQDFIQELRERQEATESGTQPPSPVRTVTFDEVSFSYETGESIFDGLSFTVDRGEFVAFVGPSGAGKSTIVSLLSRMYEPDAGAILANNTPISEFDISAWRSQVSVVRQNPFIFNDTLRRNVTVADRSASQTEIERVCEIAQVTEFLDDLPQGYDTVLGDEGVRLSGGQKQRVALARALLKDADLLVLDEATSDLDSNIESDVHHAIESMDRDYAILVIAHRLSTVVNADRIYTIEDGEVVESGSHDDLIANDGIYADLYQTQTHTH